MPTRFSNYSTTVSSCPDKLLPLAHTLDWREFLKLMESGTTLRAPVCDVFDPERIAYLFYGRPCYKVHMGQKPNSNIANDSVCIIFDASTVGTPKRIYPFDSGAFHLGFYESYTHPEDRKEQFEIDPDIENIKKFIGKYFGDNERYFRERMLDGHEPPVTEIDARTYMDIASARSQTRFDSRKSAIEVQIEGDINLLTANVLAVIVNEDVLDDPNVLDFIENQLGAEALGYFSPHAASEEQAIILMNFAKQFYKRIGAF